MASWCRGKSFDTFARLGPVLVSAAELPDPQALAISTDLNGERVQDGHTSDMILSVAEIIAFLSGSTTRLSGTGILTGTPEGVGMAANPPRWLKGRRSGGDHDRGDRDAPQSGGGGGAAGIKGSG